MDKKIFICALIFLYGVFMFGADFMQFDEKTNNLLKIQQKAEKPYLYFFNDLLPDNFFNLLKSQEKIQFYPLFSDRKSWEQAKNSSHAKHIASAIIEAADEILNTVPVELTKEDFYLFITTGDRKTFENKYFSRRKNLSYLALAACLTGNKEKYLPKLIEYTNAILNENTWCIPAHCVWTDKKLGKHHQCDLFTGDTAAMLAIMVNILGDELNQYEDNLAEKINAAVIANTFGNLLNEETHSLNYWYHAEWSWNWVPWCSSNLITVALLAAPSPELRAEYIQMMFYPLARYYNSSDDDGFTPEGASYFPVAAGMLFYALESLEKAIPNSTEKIYQEEKIKRMMSFISEICIGKNMITYSDSSPKSRPNHLLTAQIAKRLNSAEMANILAGTSLKLDSSQRLLYRNLQAFFDYPTHLTEGKNTQMHSTLFRNRLAILRTKGFSASLKAGHNNEPHNHNDLGHFTVYYKEKPIIIDVGTGPYSAIDFSDKRFTLWYTRGNGHNAPVINGCEQENDQTDIATIAEIHENDGILSTVCDLSKAYPERAEIIKFERKLRCSEDFVEIADDLQTSNNNEFEISLFTMEKPILKDNAVVLGEVKLILDNLICTQANMEIEKFGGWDYPIYRILLKGKTGKYSMKFIPYLP